LNTLMLQLTLFPLNDCRNCFFKGVFSHVTFLHFPSPSDIVDFEIVGWKWISVLFVIFSCGTWKLEGQRTSPFSVFRDEQFGSITEEESVRFSKEFAHCWKQFEVERNFSETKPKSKYVRLLFYLIWF
jgi:hypothetical protein